MAEDVSGTTDSPMSDEEFQTYLDSLPAVGGINWRDVGSVLRGAKDIFTGGQGAGAQVAALAGLGGALGLFKSSKPPGYKGGIPSLTATRTQVPPPTPAAPPTAGASPPPPMRPGGMGRRYFSPTTYAPKPAAQGGLMELARGGSTSPPRYLRGGTDGMADKIPSSIDNRQPAKLSHGEFVIPADVVSHLGNGNSDAGAKVLYKMMDRVRQARTGNKKQGRRINPAKFTPGGIAGYADGGAVAFDAGGVAGDVSTESNLSAYIGPYVTDYLGKGQALAGTDYQAYTGPLTAGESGLQSKVFSGFQGMDFPGNLGKSFSASGAYQLPTPGGAASGPGGIAANYMNPYLQAVLTPQLDELRRQSQITQMGNASKLTQAGAFGGSRQAIMDSETQRNLLQQQNKAIGEGYANAYDKAMGQFNTEQGQAKTLADMMAGAGKTQRDIEAEGIAADRAQFEEERLHPYKQLEFQQSLIKGLPVSTETTSEATSGLGQLSGGLGGLIGLAEQIKKLFPTG